MSYYLEMRFLPVTSREAAFNTCLRFAAAIASEGLSQEYLQILLSRTQELPQSSEERMVFIQAVFQVHFAYWPQHKLLGLFTKSWPEEVFGEFTFSTPIRFQDSTDQDYPLETWSDTISVFKEAKEYVATLSNEAILHAMGWDDIGPIDPDYAHRSLVYKEIYRRLDLSSWEQGGTRAI